VGGWGVEAEGLELVLQEGQAGAGHPFQDRGHSGVGGGGQDPGLGVVARGRPQVGRPGQLPQPLPWVGDRLQGGDDLGGVASFPQLEGGRDQLAAVPEVPIPDELVDQWLEPALTNPAIRRDLGKYAGDTRQGRRQLVKANPRLAGFARPVLVVWAAEDKVMPIQAGRRLAASFPDSRFVEIPDSRTLIPIDQPRALAGAIATFISNT
jgi:pimeloyl-ACP methyl ester carboxylesterase